MVFFYQRHEWFSRFHQHLTSYTRHLKLVQKPIAFMFPDVAFLLFERNPKNVEKYDVGL